MATNLGGRRGPISEMHPNSLQSQEERDRRYNDLNAIRGRPGKPLDEGPLVSYRQKALERAADELLSMWGKVKNDPSVYLKIERGGDLLPRLTMKWGITC